MGSALIAVGDELVAGFTLDTNSHWLAQRLRVLGFPLVRKTTVRDREDEIADAVRHDLAEPAVDDLFVMGGLGPTPDDRTFAGVAVALRRNLEVWEETRARIERRVKRMHDAGLMESDEMTEANLRMARIPAGPLHVFRNRRGMAPGVVYQVDRRRLFVLPGVPREMEGIVTEELEPEFLAGRSGSTVLELRFRFAVEALFYPIMKELADSHPDVSVGSYPDFETKELVIRCLGDDPRRVEEAAELVRRRAPSVGAVAAS